MESVHHQWAVHDYHSCLNLWKTGQREGGWKQKNEWTQNSFCAIMYTARMTNCKRARRPSHLHPPLSLPGAQEKHEFIPVTRKWGGKGCRWTIFLPEASERGWLTTRNSTPLSAPPNAFMELWRRLRQPQVDVFSRKPKNGRGKRENPFIDAPNGFSRKHFFCFVSVFGFLYVRQVRRPRKVFFFLFYPLQNIWG